MREVRRRESERRNNLYANFLGGSGTEHVANNKLDLNLNNIINF